MNRADYKRLVSYIYSYPGGMRDSNVGFAKAEVRNGVLALNVSLTCLHREVPEIFSICLMFDANNCSTFSDSPDTYVLLPVGNVVINCGRGAYHDIFNSQDIASSGFTFCEIKGIALMPRNDTYYRCFSLWDADDVDISRCEMLEMGYRRCNDMDKRVKNYPGNYYTRCEPTDSDDSKLNSYPEYSDESEHNSYLKYSDELSQNTAQASEDTSIKKISACSSINDEPSNGESDKSECRTQFTTPEFINVFDDGYYYDCTEITPEDLEKQIACESFAENSFVMHQFHRYKHLLLGKVADTDSGTQYFIGVPGMYSNKERQFALMFGFNSFKKSHRSDYPNPYFGYWYMEV